MLCSLPAPDVTETFNQMPSRDNTLHQGFHRMGFEVLEVSRSSTGPHLCNCFSVCPKAIFIRFMPLHLLLNVLLPHSTGNSSSIKIKPLKKEKQKLPLGEQEHLSLAINWIGEYYCCSVAKPRPALYDLTDCSKPGFPVLHRLLELA